MLRFALIFAFCAFAFGQDTWHAMFDGKTLQGWKETPFRGRGTVKVENGTMVLGSGAPMTGVNYTAEIPKTNYEVRYEAARMTGSDFFASFTFPVEESAATFVTGGWGGDIVGVSSIDGWDASDNETRTYFEFQPEHWYKFRIRVTTDLITAWIDDSRVVNVQIRGRKISMRPGESRLSAPCGISSYASTGAIRKIEYRTLQAAELKN